MGAELTLCQTPAWMVTKSSRRRTCSERRQISLGLQGQELLKLKTCSREAASETEAITEERTEVQLNHTHYSQAKAAILPTAALCVWHKASPQGTLSPQLSQEREQTCNQHQPCTAKSLVGKSSTDPQPSFTACSCQPLAIHQSPTSRQHWLGQDAQAMGYSPDPQVGSTSSHHGSTSLNKSNLTQEESLQNTTTKTVWKGHQGRRGSILWIATAESKDDWDRRDLYSHATGSTSHQCAAEPLDCWE